MSTRPPWIGDICESLLDDGPSPEDPKALWIQRGNKFAEDNELYKNLDVEFEVQQLRLSGDSEPDYSWIDESLPLLQRLQNLRILRLEKLPWIRVSPAVRSLLLTQFAKITTLWLDKSDFGNSYQLLRVLDAYPFIKNLAITHVEYELNNYTTHQVSSRVPLRLDELIIGELGWPDPVLEWILGQRISLVVKNAVQTWRLTDYSVFVWFLRSIAPDVQHLTFYQRIRPVDQGAQLEYVDPSCLLGDEEVDPDETVRQARLSGKPTIDTLSYTDAVKLVKQPLERAWLETIEANIKWSGNMRLDILAVETLCHLIAPTTMEFELTIRMRTVSQWERTDWHALDAALSLVTKWLGGRYRPVAIFAAPFLGDKQLYYPDTELPKTSDLGVFILRTTSNEKAGWA